MLIDRVRVFMPMKYHNDFVIALCLLSNFSTGATNIATDGTLGPAKSLSGPDFMITPSLGQQVGPNLFHSFARFSVLSGESATFAGPGSIDHLISRVTGLQTSFIDGPVQSTIPGADFWFINPAGIVFGNGASLNVPGAFHVSTAQEIRFADDARFSAVDPNGGALTAAPPQAFGFLDLPVAPIVLNGGTLLGFPGQSVSLVGGDVNIAGGTVTASGGVVNIASVAGTGELRPDDFAVDVTQQGEVVIIGSRVDASGDQGGTVRIAGGEIRIAASSVTSATGVQDGGSVSLEGNEINLDLGSVVGTSTHGSGRAGAVEITADQLTVSSGATAASATLSTGNAGAVTVDAKEISISGGGSTSRTGIASLVQPGATGDAGDVDISAHRLAVDGAGSTGNHSETGIASLANPGSGGDAGTIRIVASEVELRTGGVVSSSTFGTGNAGTVDVEADRIIVSGAADFELRPGIPFPSAIASTAESGSAGNAGRVQVTANENLVLTDGGNISTGTQATGAAGEVVVNAGNITIDRGAAKSRTGIASTAGEGVPGADVGNAGETQVTVQGRLELRGGGGISSSTFAKGNAGTVRVKAGELLVSGASSFVDPGVKSLQPSAVASSAERGAQGSGGDVLVTAEIIRLDDQGAITARSFSPEGDAGDITVEVSKDLSLRNNGQITTVTDLANGGNIAIGAGNLVELRDSEIATSVAGGTGSGGDIAVSSRFVVLDSSELRANALQGSGGNIGIRTGQFIVSPDSVIDASSELGVDGEVVIDALEADVMAYLETLPTRFAEVPVVLPTPCVARSGAKAIHLYARRYEVLPDSPYALRSYLPVPTEEGETRDAVDDVASVAGQKAAVARVDCRRDE